MLSENNEVYRGEYLAYLIFELAKKNKYESLDILYSKSEEQLVEIVQKFMEPRYQEGYTKGVHDMDGAKILKSLLELHHKIDLLIYSSESRALARLFWKCLAKKDTKDLLRKRLKELSKVSIFFSSSPNLESYLIRAI